jgi:hypothetical protein
MNNDTLSATLAKINELVSEYLDSNDGDPAVIADELREIADEVFGE